jgi:branched-chain amino acid transport system substrate-binding protein
MKLKLNKLVVSTALLLSACTAWATDPIKIGSVLSLTGPAGYLGDPELKTLEMYIDNINKKGGVLGRLT